MSVRLESLSQLLPSGQAGLSKTADDNTAQAAQGLESMFLRYLLAQMRGSQAGGLLDGGYAGKVFRQLMDEAIADAMAASGGLGIGGQLEEHIGGSRIGQGAAGADSPSPWPGLRAARRAYEKQPGEILHEITEKK